MKRFFLLLNTIKYLKVKQIYYRFARKFTWKKSKEIIKAPEPSRSKQWKHFRLYEDKINEKYEASFLNYTKKLDLPNDWNNKLLSKLWVYNLHYFEDLLSKSSRNKTQLHHKLLEHWIDDNPIGYGNGWEPYTTSLRITNILKAWLGGLELDGRVLNSVYIQTNFLSFNLEKHLLGNHYFANLKALLFSGAIFKNSRWLNIAEKALLDEIPEQILADGSNFELSPMYHSIVLTDMLDIYNLCKSYPGFISSKIESLSLKYIPKMLNFMETVSHPDGGVSFFNDSVDGIAPSKKDIETYAKDLGFTINHFNSGITQIYDNQNSGYISATTGHNKLIFDASPIGPDYIPGHAHADTLSFELSIDLQRVFVNSGVSEYGLSQKRLNQRKTFSHNTVEVDGKDSSEVWSSFRVGNRAKVIDRYTKLGKDQKIILGASHDGYNSLINGCIHKRKLIFKKNRLDISDSLIGTYMTAKSRFYFHPDLLISLHDNLLRVQGLNFLLLSDLSGKKAALIDSTWNPQFGIEVPNKLLELNFNEPQLDIVFTWTKY